MPEKSYTATELLKHLGALKNRRTEYETRWKEQADYFNPRLNTFGKKSGQRASKPAHLYDATGIHALRMHSDGIQGYLIPRSSKWKMAKMAELSLGSLDRYKKFLQETDEALDGELNRSNFYEAIGDALDGGILFGTSTVYAEDDLAAGILNYKPFHAKEVWIAEDQYGRIDTWFRSFEMSGKRILEQFGEEAFTKNEKLQPFIARFKESPYAPYDITHCVFPRSTFDVKKKDAANKPIASIYILDAASEIVEEGGWSFPRMTTWRYRTVVGDEYGSCPADDGLVDMKRLSAISESKLLATQLAVQPPQMVPEELAAFYKGEPGERIPYLSATLPITPVNMLGNIPYGLDEENEIKQSIMRMFYADFFLLMSQADRSKTAMETNEIAGEKAAVMSALVGRIESELLDPLLDITYKVAYTAGRMPAPPEELVAAAMKKKIDLPFRYDYVGPLAQLQRRHHGQQSLIQTLGQAAPVIQFNPPAADNINFDVLLRKTFEKAGGDADVLYSEEERDARREAAAQKQAQAEQAAMMKTIGQAAGGLGKSPEEGSPMEGLMQEGSL